MGYGPNAEYANLHGLYHPVYNCFLIVLPDYTSIGAQLTAILSSRYLLQPVQLDTADNYYHNIIDNTVCENWTISNLAEISSADLILRLQVVKALKLIPTLPRDLVVPIEQEKNWAQFCLFWLRFFQHLRQRSVAGLWIDQQLGNISMFRQCDSLLPSEYVECCDKILQLLYLGLDVNHTNLAIMTQIDLCDKYLAVQFENFLNTYHDHTENTAT